MRTLGWFLAGLLTAALWLHGPVSAAAPPHDPPGPYPVTLNAGWYYLQDVTKAIHLRAYWQPWTAMTTLDTYPAGTDSLQLLTADGRVEINHPLRQVRLSAPNGVNVSGPLTADTYMVAGTPGITATVALAGGGRLLIQGGLVVGVLP